MPSATTNQPDSSSSSKCIDVRFSDVSYEIPSKNEWSKSLRGKQQEPPTKILHNISGYVGAGESLAILGPSGSGKTSFLNLLAARSEHPPSNGQISFGGRPRLPRTKRHIGYVMQDDVFFSKLTVRETLEFTANIRLGHSLSYQQRSQRIDHVLRRLRLTKCQHTRIGDQQFDKGISGGERKRVNIANELLHEPNLLLADECTSGLDSSSAFTVINLLRELCVEGRTVIATIHQPSSQMFSLFDKIMLLAAGRVAYFGTPGKVVSYFTSIDFPFPENAYNPADYMLELVIDDVELETDQLELETIKIESTAQPSKQQRILDAWQQNGPVLLLQNEKELKSKFRSKITNTTVSSATDEEISSAEDENTYDICIEPDFMKDDPLPPTSRFGRCMRAVQKRLYDITGQHKKNQPEKYDNNWFMQAYFLARRSLRQKRGVLFQPIYIIQLICVILISSLFWFQIEEREGSIEDRLGALSFFCVFWAFYSTFSVLFAFPAEKQVVNKDRAGGNYRLSAYYFAKTLVETPADMLYPFVFSCVVYPMIGLNRNFGAFVLFSVILTLNILTAQGIGLFISAIFMDVRQGQVLGSVWILGSMLISGYYIDPENTPGFVKPLRAISFIKFSYEGLVRTEMLFGQSFKCEENEKLQTIYSRFGCPINSERLLKAAEIDSSLSILLNIVVLIAWIIAFRVVGYFALKLLHTNHKPKLSSWKQK